MQHALAGTSIILNFPFNTKCDASFLFSFLIVSRRKTTTNTHTHTHARDGGREVGQVETIENPGAFLALALNLAATVCIGCMARVASAVVGAAKGCHIEMQLAENAQRSRRRRTGTNNAQFALGMGKENGIQCVQFFQRMQKRRAHKFMH